MLKTNFGKRRSKVNVLIWIISGIVAGWIAGLLVRGRGFGLIGDLIIGLLGGLIGGWLAGLLGIQASGWIAQILVAALGGIVLVAVIRLIRRI
jgi:uncharacterized membrane protein YeaQ/YmgE (transglycosylase-associated protein family)